MNNEFPLDFCMECCAVMHPVNIYEETLHGRDADFDSGLASIITENTTRPPRTVDSVRWNGAAIGVDRPSTTELED